MMPHQRSNKFSVAMVVMTVGFLMAAAPAHAFRCKSRIVKDGMHEQQVIAICGEPTTRRDLGHTVRSVDFGLRRGRLSGVRSDRYPVRGHISEAVVITEFVYNFGPRKLMRRLRFEGGVLVNIDTIGYGYLEKNSR